jgi:methionyl-tRNA formyltransferase
MGCLGGERYNGASMFDTIVLLTGAVEHPILTPVLHEHNPRLSVLPVSASDELAAVETTVLRRARLIAFTTNAIVPPNVLDQLG